MSREAWEALITVAIVVAVSFLIVAFGIIVLDGDTVHRGRP